MIIKRIYFVWGRSVVFKVILRLDFMLKIVRVNLTLCWLHLNYLWNCIICPCFHHTVTKTVGTCNCKLICDQFINKNTRSIEYTPLHRPRYCSFAKQSKSKMTYNLRLVKYDITLYNVFIYVVYLLKFGQSINFRHVASFF